MPDLDRADLARKSYEEVLDATKHQDDKIGRFLTVIAFLTAAAVTFGVRDSSVFSVRYDMVQTDLALPAILFGSFFGLVIISVLLFMIGLGPNLNLPGVSFAETPRATPHSHLFFLFRVGKRKRSGSDYGKRQMTRCPLILIESL
jgi:hypothetical protein